ncbi:MAG: transporter, partial [Legionellales bacterium]
MEGYTFSTLVFLTALSVVTLKASAQSSLPGPCDGPNALLTLVNRPSVLDSACVTPDKQAILELGYNHQFLTERGTQDNLPQAEFRYGLADLFEFAIILPNYINKSVPRGSGFAPTTLSIKKELVATPKWISTVEGLVTLPSGSYAYGAQGPGAAFNSINSYTITTEIAVTTMLGVSSLSEPVLSGGHSFLSINPIVLVSWTKNKTSLYGEISGQSKTGFAQGSGFNLDMGVIYLLKKTISIDFEV